MVIIPLRTIVIGISVGVTATCFNAPFDVVKSRFQSQLPGNKKYTSIIGTLQTIAREEGPRALYRGFVPKALRLGIGQTIGLMTFKKVPDEYDFPYDGSNVGLGARADDLIV